MNDRYTVLRLIWWAMLILVAGLAGPHSPSSFVSIGFSGVAQDKVSGCALIGHGTRSYCSALRTFFRFDDPLFSPFGIGGLNSLAYVNHDPNNFEDVLGYMRTRTGEDTHMINENSAEFISLDEHMKMIQEETFGELADWIEKNHHTSSIMGHPSSNSQPVSSDDKSAPSVSVPQAAVSLSAAPVPQPVIEPQGFEQPSGSNQQMVSDDGESIPPHFLAQNSVALPAASSSNKVAEKMITKRENLETRDPLNYMDSTLSRYKVFVLRNRKARRLGLRKLGKITDINFHTISKYELGQRNISLASLQKIAEALDVTLDDLIDQNKKVSDLVQGFEL